MGLLNPRTWLCAALALLAVSCGRFAIRPPTPSAKLDSALLNYADPGERFYAIVYASQTVPRRPPYSHTWATVVRVVDHPGRAPSIEADTISWLPATLNIKPLRTRVEPGVNLGMHESIVYALGNHERVSMWGPYECRPSFYRRFLIQKEFIESGRVGYQCADNFGEAARTGNGCCCIHAVTDMDPEYGRENYPLIWFGDSASEHIVNRVHESGALLYAEIEHDWLIAALGLDAHCIVRRHYHDRLFDFPRLQPGRVFRRAGNGPGV
jgi:hypothetical protein